MKKIIVLLGFIMSMVITSRAQVSVHFNLGLQPAWGPTGYDYVDYYYIPDIDAYYSVSDRTYTYYDGGDWVTTSYLPQRYSNFDLYGAHKVVINEPRPWLRHDLYHRDYYRYRGYHDQGAIRDSRDYRYYQNPGHPRHNEWHGDRHDNGRHEGWNRGEGHGDHGGHGDGRGHGDGHGRRD